MDFVILSFLLYWQEQIEFAVISLPAEDTCLSGFESTCRVPRTPLKCPRMSKIVERIMVLFCLSVLYFNLKRK